MLYWSQVWKHMHKLTGRDIEKRAVMEFISYFEEQMDRVIAQSKKELKKRNSLQRMQGIRLKHRIDRNCVREAIKTINDDGYTFVSEGTGGNISRKEKNENHSQKNTEVA